MVDFGPQPSPDQTPFQDMNQGLDHLRAEDIQAVPASSMDQDLMALRQHINGCEAEFTRRLTRFDKGGGYEASGALTAKAWLRWKCNFLTFGRLRPRCRVSRAGLLASNDGSVCGWRP